MIDDVASAPHHTPHTTHTHTNKHPLPDPTHIAMMYAYTTQTHTAQLAPQKTHNRSTRHSHRHMRSRTCTRMIERAQRHPSTRTHITYIHAYAHSARSYTKPPHSHGQAHTRMWTDSWVRTGRKLRVGCSMARVLCSGASGGWQRAFCADSGCCPRARPEGPSWRRDVALERRATGFAALGSSARGAVLSIPILRTAM
jgi:hypothetical protein